MRVLQVTLTYYPELKFGGPPQKIHALSRRLVERGHEVRVITFNSEQPSATNLVRIDSVDVQYLSWRGKGYWQVPVRLKELNASVKWADVVHCYGLYTLLCPIAARAARLAGRAYLLEPLGMYVPRTGNLRLKSLYHKLFTGRMARGASAVVATSQAEAEELTSLAAPRRPVIRRNGLDLAAYENLPSGATFRARYDLGEQRVVLFVGRISQIKNLEQLINAFQLARLEQTVLVLVGPVLEPEYAEKLRRLVERLDMGGRVLFTGPLYDEDKLSALSAARLFVLPSLYESYGNAAAEAVAAGVPVLLTEDCGIAPQIHQRAGLAVSRTTEALAEGLRIMSSDETKRAALTARRAEVLRELSWEQPVEQLLSLYHELIKEGGTAAAAAAAEYVR
jgi:glycosyltransferase involved in cell wall biosynthesis